MTSEPATCEACDAGMRLAADGIHYDDARGGWTWGVCRKVVAKIRLDRVRRSPVRVAGVRGPEPRTTRLCLVCQQPIGRGQRFFDGHYVFAHERCLPAEEESHA